MNVGSGKNRKEIQSLCGAGESEEVHCYLVTVGVLWKETTLDGHCSRVVARYNSAAGDLAHELLQGSLNAQ
jgi:hypothetical protein